MLTTRCKVSLILSSLSFVCQSIILASNLLYSCILCPYIRCFWLLLAHINTVRCFNGFGLYDQVLYLTCCSLCWYGSWLCTSCMFIIVTLTYSIQIKFVLTWFDLLECILDFELIFVCKINESLTERSTNLKEHWYGKVAIFVKASIGPAKRAF